MKLRNPPHPLRAGGQKRRSEMERAFLLAEAGSRHNADARGVEEAETVELVRGAVLLFGLLDGAGGKGDGWVKVHGALEWVWLVWDCG